MAKLSVRGGNLEMAIEADISGDIWTGAAKRKLAEASSSEVLKLAKKGYWLVHNKLPTATGRTRSGLEVHQTRAGSLYAKVRMAEDLPARGSGPSAARAPYIIANVWESGRYGGHKEYRVRVLASGARSRSTWVKGKKIRVAHWAFKNAEKVLKRDAAAWRAEALTRDWNL